MSDPRIQELLTKSDGESVYPVWWSFDTFVAGLIAEVAKTLREEGHGHPGDMTPEEWDLYLTEVEEPLRSWVGLEESWDKKAYERAQQALHKFADRFGSWWD